MGPAVKPKHGMIAFLVSLICFIPVLGIIFSLVYLIVATVSSKSNSKYFALIALAGIGFNYLLFQYAQEKLFEDKVFYADFEPHAVSELTAIVRHIEYFKLQNGRYPHDLNELKATVKDGEMLTFVDFSAPRTALEPPREFHFELINEGSNYLLFGIGQDNVLYSDDDVLPIIDKEKDQNIGWVSAK